MPLVSLICVYHGIFLVFSSIMKHSFVGYSNVYGQLLSFRAWNTSLHALGFRVSATFLGLLFCVTCCSSLSAFFLSVFCRLIVLTLLLT